MMAISWGYSTDNKWLFFSCYIFESMYIRYLLTACSHCIVLCEGMNWHFELKSNEKYPDSLRNPSLF